MVELLKRMRKLHTRLLWIRCGPGALILPKEVSKISMEFNTKLYGGHRGARKFWREMLPRMKYRNPTVLMEIHRHTQADGPSLLHIFTHTKPTATPQQPQQQQGPAASTPEAPTSEPTYTLNIRDQQESEILETLLKTLPGCQEVPATEADQEKMKELAEKRERSEMDRQLMRETLLMERKEAEMLKLARGETDASFA
ncbi:hypothetical protein IAQ61_009239 [Plenodomus lingam]|nr:hypothetical protein IAQ61_009239 [Plenodomus lingam]